MGAPAQRVSIPIFPLTNVVLFPGVQAPLHIFEPRYRAMTADALVGARMIGMAAVRDEQAAAETADPALFPFGCAGVIHDAERLPDGRYHLVLVGTQRFRIEHEPARPPDRLYRVAEVTLLEDVQDPCDTPRLEQDRRQVISLFAEIVRRTNPSRSEEISEDLFTNVADCVFVNTFCQLLELEPVEKQSLLQTERIADRCQQLATLLRFRLAELSGQLPDGDRRVH
jgi:Lon protease-like protein